MRRAAGPGAPEGGLVVDKPAGPTSHDIVAAARRALAQPRIGHTGTLDPMATGVLTLLLGRATRLAQYLSGSDKTYLATLSFGQATSTYDAEGEPVGPASAAEVDSQALALELERFRGRQLQRPPAVSAKKVGGARAYDLARAHRPVALEPAAVEVSDLHLVAFDGRQALVRLTVSAGFYVRSFAHDLGQRLGVGAHLTALRRERSGRFDLAHSIAFERLVNAPQEALAQVVRPAQLLPDWPSVTLSQSQLTQIGHGRPLAAAGASGDSGARCRLLDGQGELVALAESRGGALHPVLVLV